LVRTKGQACAKIRRRSSLPFSLSMEAFLDAQPLLATAKGGGPCLALPCPALPWCLCLPAAAREMAAYTERIVSPAHRPVRPAINSVHAVTERLGAEPPVVGRSAPAGQAQPHAPRNGRTKRDVGYPARAAPGRGRRLDSALSVFARPAWLAAACRKLVVRVHCLRYMAS
jgi:hypothetical protein